MHLRPQLSETGSVVRGYFSTPSVREAEMRDYQRVLDPKLPTLVLGDFNESTSGAATTRLQNAGFEDLLEAYRPSADTWRWTTSFGTFERGLDRVLYDGHPALKPLDVEVMERGRSDHLPILATFEVVARPPVR